MTLHAIASPPAMIDSESLRRCMNHSARTLSLARALAALADDLDSSEMSTTVFNLCAILVERIDTLDTDLSYLADGVEVSA